jgi:hypothetical protein
MKLIISSRYFLFAAFMLTAGGNNGFNKSGQFVDRGTQGGGLQWESAF